LLFLLHSAIATMAEAACFNEQMLSADCLTDHEHQKPQMIDLSNQHQPRQQLADGSGNPAPLFVSWAVSPVGDYGKVEKSFNCLEHCGVGPAIFEELIGHLPFQVLM